MDDKIKTQYFMNIGVTVMGQIEDQGDTVDKALETDFWTAVDTKDSKRLSFIVTQLANQLN